MPTVLPVTLAVGVQQLVKDKAIVSRITAIIALGLSQSAESNTAGDDDLNRSSTLPVHGNVLSNIPGFPSPRSSP